MELLDGVNQLTVAKGKKVVQFDLKKDRPLDDELVAAMTGPTGNLRAPSLKSGKRMFIGFHEEAYEVLC